MKQVAKGDTEPLKTRDSEINEEVLEESMELEAETIRSDASILKYVLTIPSNILRPPHDHVLSLVFLQGLPGSMPWGVYTIYLHNILCTEKRMSIDLVCIAFELNHRHRH